MKPKCSKTDLTPSAPAVPRPRLDENEVLSCQFGDYPWDRWHRWAIAQGLDEKLAGTGRSLIREAYNHSWDDRLKADYGWSDDGQAMLDHALRAPKVARRQWDILLRTDGLRGDYRPRTTDWTWGFLKADARRLLSKLQSQENLL